MTTSPTFSPAKAYARYSATAFDLIPLHLWTDKRKGKNGKVQDLGKAPVHNDWTKRVYNSAKVRAAAIEANRNIGVRLREDQIVIDVDPRNGGEEGFSTLCHDLELDPDEWPRVITGSGGWHCYMSKPADVLVRDTLEEYKGVEFKTKGRQVVAAGARHPNGKFYRWSKDHPKIEDGLPKIPTTLLNMIKRPPRSSTTGGGQYDQMQIAELLSKLDPEKFQDQTKWFQLMQACHHASNGHARHEFVEWSTQDPAYANDAEIIGRRWDSLDADRDDGITFKTLNMHIAKAGHQSSLPAPDVTTDDFADDIEDDMDFDTPDDDDDEELDEPFVSADLKRQEKARKAAQAIIDGIPEPDDVEDENVGGLNDEAINALEALNQKYITVVEAGKFRIMYQEQDGQNNDRVYWQAIDRQSFETLYCNRNIMRDMRYVSRNAQPTMPLGEAWIKWPARKAVKGIVFKPDSPIGENDGWLNLWQGFEIKPSAKGTWDIMREHIFENISGGDQKIYNYIMRYLAYMMQYPGRAAKAAIVLKGGMGIGKGILGNALVKMIGQHAISVGDSNLLTGRFNAHLKNLIFLFADEAVNPYQKEAEAKLRHLITEPTLQIEKKGVDIGNGVPNILHVMMASNDDWVIGVNQDDRRYFVQNVLPRWKGKTDKWNALVAELERDNNSGYRRFMFDLMAYKIPEGWAPKDIPVTEALIQQKTFSFKPVHRFIFNWLHQKNAKCRMIGDWMREPVQIFADDFHDAFNSFCTKEGIKPGSSGRATTSLFHQEIQDCIPATNINLRIAPPKDWEDVDVAAYDGKAMAIQLPKFDECCSQFERVYGFPEGMLERMVPSFKMSDWG